MTHLSTTQTNLSRSIVQDGSKDTAQISHEVPFRRRYNLKKSDREGCAKTVNMGITDIVPTPDNYGTCMHIHYQESIKTEHTPWLSHKLYMWSN